LLLSVLILWGGRIEDVLGAAGCAEETVDIFLDSIVGSGEFVNRQPEGDCPAGSADRDRDQSDGALYVFCDVWGVEPNVGYQSP
jgi:hypothetical protein